MSRAIRLAVGLPPLAALWIVGAVVEIADDLLCALHPRTKRVTLRLRDWMDCPR